jgi:hypothetical protein
MATLREMIFSAREQINAYSDDSAISDDHLAFLFQNKRATYLEVLAANPRKQMPIEAYQTLCFSLQPSNDCEDGKVILKSNLEFPASINSSQDIEGIGSVHLDSIMAKWINVISHERIAFIEAGRFNTNQIYVSKDTDDRLILLSKSNSHIFIEDIKVKIIASNPEAADKLTCSTSSSENVCDFYDKKYPIPESLVKPIISETVNELLLKLGLGQDIVNNSNDDTLNQKIPYHGPRRQQPQQQEGEQQA